MPRILKTVSQQARIEFPYPLILLLIATILGGRHPLHYQHRVQLGAPPLTLAGPPQRQGPPKLAGYPQLLATPSGAHDANVSGGALITRLAFNPER